MYDENYEILSESGQQLTVFSGPRFRAREIALQFAADLDQTIEVACGEETIMLCTPEEASED